MSETESLWLVKAGARILGPFSEFQLIHLIHTKEVSPIDEVKKPLQRWIFVRQSEELKSAVERYRDQLSGNGTQTVMEITAITEEMDIEKTAPAYNLQGAISTESLVGTATKELMPVQSESSFDQERSNVTPIAVLDPRALNRYKKSNLKNGNSGLLWPMIVTVFVFAIILGLIYFWPNKNKLAENEEVNIQSLIEQGYWREALDELDGLAKTRNLSTDEKIWQIGLVSKVERQSNHVKWLAEKIKTESKLTPQQINFVQKAVATSLSQEALYDEALQELKKSSFVNPWDILNILILKRDWVSARQSFDVVSGDLTKSQKILASNIISLAENKPIELISNEYEASAKSYLLKVLSLQRQGASRQEILNQIVLLSNTNPFVDGAITEDLFVDESSLKWSFLAQFCQKPNDQSMPGVDLWIFHFCHLVSSNFTDLKFENLILSDIDFSNLNELTSALVAYANVSVDRFAEARTFLSPSSQSYLTNLTLAKLCLVDQDYQCAEKSYQSVLRQNPNDPWANSGMINIKFNKGQIAEAKSLLRLGLKENPKFREIVQWKYKIL